MKLNELIDDLLLDLSVIYPIPDLSNPVHIKTLRKIFEERGEGELGRVIESTFLSEIFRRRLQTEGEDTKKEPTEAEKLGLVWLGGPYFGPKEGQPATHMSKDGKIEAMSDEEKEEKAKKDAAKKEKEAPTPTDTQPADAEPSEPPQEPTAEPTPTEPATVEPQPQQPPVAQKTPEQEKQEQDLQNAKTNPETVLNDPTASAQSQAIARDQAGKNATANAELPPKERAEKEEKEAYEKTKNRVDAEIKEKMEAEKADYLATYPGAEWGELEEKEFRVNQLLDMHKKEEDPAEKRRLEKMYLEQPGLTSREINRASRTFSNESVDEFIDGLGQDKLDEIIFDKDGKGQDQDYAEMVIRSKNATPEQRKQALMLQWVNGSNTAGALMMQEYMADKLNMGEKPKSGLEYRKGQGQSFEQRPYGGLRDDVRDATLKAIDDIYNETQQQFRDKGVTEVEVYRGTDTGEETPYENPMSSWTDDPSVAKEYGANVVSQKIPVERIMMGAFNSNFPDPVAMDSFNPDGTPKRSREIIVLGTPGDKPAESEPTVTPSSEVPNTQQEQPTEPTTTAPTTSTEPTTPEPVTDTSSEEGTPSEEEAPSEEVQQLFADYDRKLEAIDNTIKQLSDTIEDMKRKGQDTTAAEQTMYELARLTTSLKAAIKSGKAALYQSEKNEKAEKERKQKEKEERRKAKEAAKTPAQKQAEEKAGKLKERKTSDGESLDAETTEGGSLIIGVEHGEGTESTKQTIETIQSLPPDTKVMFVGEGGMTRDENGRLELSGEQDEIRNATQGHFTNYEETSWDENANVFDSNSPVFGAITEKLGGSRSKANAAIWSNMVGQGDDMNPDDYLDDEGKAWLIEQARKGGSTAFDGEVDWANLTEQQRKDLYELNFRDDPKYGETEIYQAQQAYNDFRQSELDRKIKEAEEQGFTVIAPVGNSHVDLWRQRNKPAEEPTESTPASEEPADDITEPSDEEDFSTSSDDEDFLDTTSTEPTEPTASTEPTSEPATAEPTEPTAPAEPSQAEPTASTEPTEPTTEEPDSEAVTSQKTKIQNAETELQTLEDAKKELEAKSPKTNRDKQQIDILNKTIPSKQKALEKEKEKLNSIKAEEEEARKEKEKVSEPPTEVSTNVEDYQPVDDPTPPGTEITTKDGKKYYAVGGGYYAETPDGPPVWKIVDDEATIQEYYQKLVDNAIEYDRPKDWYILFETATTIINGKKAVKVGTEEFDSEELDSAKVKEEFERIKGAKTDAKFKKITNTINSLSVPDEVKDRLQRIVDKLSKGEALDEDERNFSKNWMRVVEPTESYPNLGKIYFANNEGDFSSYQKIELGTGAVDGTIRNQFLVSGVTLQSTAPFGTKKSTPNRVFREKGSKQTKLVSQPSSINRDESGKLKSVNVHGYELVPVDENEPGISEKEKKKRKRTNHNLEQIAKVIEDGEFESIDMDEGQLPDTPEGRVKNIKDAIFKMASLLEELSIKSGMESHPLIDRMKAFSEKDPNENPQQWYEEFEGLFSEMANTESLKEAWPNYAEIYTAISEMHDNGNGTENGSFVILPSSTTVPNVDLLSIKVNDAKKRIVTVEGKSVKVGTGGAGNIGGAVSDSTYKNDPDGEYKQKMENYLTKRDRAYEMGLDVPKGSDVEDYHNQFIEDQDKARDEMEKYLTTELGYDVDNFKKLATAVTTNGTKEYKTIESGVQNIMRERQKQGLSTDKQTEERLRKRLQNFYMWGRTIHECYNENVDTQNFVNDSLKAQSKTLAKSKKVERVSSDGIDVLALKRFEFSTGKWSVEGRSGNPGAGRFFFKDTTMSEIVRNLSPETRKKLLERLKDIKMLTEITTLNFYQNDNEPVSGHIPDGKTRTLNVGKPESWFKQLGYTQLDKPKADNMRAKGIKPNPQDKETQYRKLSYKVQNVVSSNLNPAEKGKPVDKWKTIKNPTKPPLDKTGSRYWELIDSEEGVKKKEETAKKILKSIKKK